MKKITVIITTYNMNNYINRAINSVLNQTYKNIEIIVIDDCSKKEINLTNKKIKCYRFNKNKGIAYSRNYGIKKATGDYICFLDADDTLEKNSLKNRYEFLKKNKNKDFVYTNTKYLNNKGKQKYIKYTKTNFKDINFLDISKTPFLPITILFKRKILEDIKFNPKYKRSVDADFIYRLLNKYKDKGIFLNKVTYNYYKNIKSKKEKIKINLISNFYKIKIINKLIKNPIKKTYLIITNSLFIPIKIIHQLLFFNK